MHPDPILDMFCNTWRIEIESLNDFFFLKDYGISSITFVRVFSPWMHTIMVMVCIVWSTFNLMFHRWNRTFCLSLHSQESVIYNHWHHTTNEPSAFFARVYDGSYNDSSDTASMRTRSSRPFSPSVVSNPLARDYSLPHLDPLGDDVSESIRHYAVDPMETSIRQSFKRVLNDVIARGPPGQKKLRARVPDHLAVSLKKEKKLLTK